LPEVRLSDPPRFDLAASLVFLAGTTLLLWGIKHCAAELAFDREGVIALVIGAVLFAGFIARCLTAKNPLVDLSLFRSRTFIAGVVATIGCTFAMAVLLYLLAQWLQVVNGDDAFEAGLKLVPMALASIVASAGAMWLAAKFQVRNIVFGGLALAALAMIMLVFFREDLEVGPILVSTALVGVGTGALALGASLIMCETPPEKASSAGSLQEISYDLGNVLGVAILGSVASMIYRSGLPGGPLREMGLDSSLIDQCRESFATTALIADELGLPELFRRGVEAFDDSVVLTALAGGVVILVVAVIVRALIPRDVDITAQGE